METYKFPVDQKSTSDLLGDGFEYFLIFTLLGEDSHFD